MAHSRSRLKQSPTHSPHPTQRQRLASICPRGMRTTLTKPRKNANDHKLTPQAASTPRQAVSNIHAPINAIQQAKLSHLKTTSSESKSTAAGHRSHTTKQPATSCLHSWAASQARQHDGCLTHTAACHSSCVGMLQHPSQRSATLACKIYWQT